MEATQTAVDESTQPTTELLVETWEDGKVSLTQTEGGHVVAWMEPGLEAYAEPLVSAFNAALAAKAEAEKQKRQRVVRIRRDDMPESPRDWECNYGVMACWHNRGNYGDVQPKEDPAEWLKANAPKGSIVLNIFMYEHSGIALRATEAGANPFADPFDSGQLGYIVATPERIRQLSGWKRLTKKRRESIVKALKQEVKSYEDFIMGNVWSWEVLDGNGDTIDSCGGIYLDMDDSLEGSGILEMVDEAEGVTEDMVHAAWEARYES